MNMNADVNMQKENNRERERVCDKTKSCHVKVNVKRKPLLNEMSLSIRIHFIYMSKVLSLHTVLCMYITRTGTM